MNFSVAVDVLLCNLATSLRFHVVVSAAGETADRQADKLISNTPLRASQCRALTRMLMSGLRRQPMERLSDYSVERPVYGANLWNDCLITPSSVSCAPSQPVFTQRLKTFLMRRSYPDLRQLTDAVLEIMIITRPR